MFHLKTSDTSLFWWIYSLLLCGCCVALGSVWMMEFGFSIVPCSLCLWQRVPYYAAIVVLVTYGVLGFFIPKIHTPSFKGSFFILITLIFLLSGLLALYHAGIEWHFWAQTDTCSGQESIVDFERWRQELEHATVTQCDESPFRIIGLSPAGWNALLSLSLATLASYGAWQIRSSGVR